MDLFFRLDVIMLGYHRIYVLSDVLFSFRFVFYILLSTFLLS